MKSREGQTKTIEDQRKNRKVEKKGRKKRSQRKENSKTEQRNRLKAVWKMRVKWEEMDWNDNFLKKYNNFTGVKQYVKLKNKIS